MFTTFKRLHSNSKEVHNTESVVKNEVSMHFVTAHHPLRPSWRSIRNKVRICRQIQYDLAHVCHPVVSRSSSKNNGVLTAVRPRFLISSVEQQIYTILVTFLDQIIESYHITYSTWACRKFGRQLASVLRAISFDHEYCWRLLENRILYYLVLKHYNISVLLAWHTFIGALSDTVIKGFCQATFADLPKQLPTIFEDSPAECFLYIEPYRPTFLVKLLNLFVCSIILYFVRSIEGNLINRGSEAEEKHSQEKPCGPAQILPKNAETYRVLYAYKPKNVDELELQENDIVFVVEKCDDGWFIGLSFSFNHL
ncbi:unnamed protein product [Thelazia callipaeda]|uniref:SH3 domain-containing protein n=1 Tax=Thelazia callipaeda TaxID=103827 RepID=A0A0N5D1D9_THECL|nr:unnamed protein product [Thelazia callipaeda]